MGLLLNLGLLIGTVVAATIALVCLVTRIVRFPYKVPGQGDPSGKKDPRDDVVLLAGSFNPLHKGHSSILQYLSAAHAKVYVVVGVNYTKKYDVSPETRR